MLWRVLWPILRHREKLRRMLRGLLRWVPDLLAGNILNCSAAVKRLVERQLVAVAATKTAGDVGAVAVAVAAAMAAVLMAVAVVVVAVRRRPPSRLYPARCQSYARPWS
jgi:hypothetical protein